MKLFQEISDGFEEATIAFVLVGGHAVIVALLSEHHRNPDDIQDICDRFGSDAVMKKIRFLYECEQSA